MNVNQLRSYENLRKYLENYNCVYEIGIKKLREGDCSYDEYFDDQLRKLYK